MIISLSNIFVETVSSTQSNTLRSAYIQCQIQILPDILSKMTGLKVNEIVQVLLFVCFSQRSFKSSEKKNKWHWSIFEFDLYCDLPSALEMSFWL